jgi:hypothetical protein
MLVMTEYWEMPMFVFLQDFEGRNLVGIDATDPNGFDDVVFKSFIYLWEEKLSLKCVRKTFCILPTCLTLEHR